MRSLVKILIFALIAVLLEVTELYFNRRYGGAGFKVKIIPNLPT